MADNRARILAQTLSVDAWHEPFRIDQDTSGVHVEISFSQGRMGGDDDSFPFTFKIALKRALLTVKVEHPLSIDRGSVARSKPVVDAERTTILALREAIKSNAAVKGKVTPASVHLGLSGEIKSEDEVTTQQKLKVVQSIPAIIVSPIPVSSTVYTWDLTPGHSETLLGQPWDPVSEPRMRVRTQGQSFTIEPTITVQVSCALEDIEISDLQPKRDDLNQKLRNVIHGDVSLAAAIQFLKRILKDADLEVGALDNRFSDLLIADVLAIAE